MRKAGGIKGKTRGENNGIYRSELIFSLELDKEVGERLVKVGG